MTDKKVYCKNSKCKKDITGKRAQSGLHAVFCGDECRLEHTKRIGWNYSRSTKNR